MLGCLQKELDVIFDAIHYTQKPILHFSISINISLVELYANCFNEN